MKSLESGSEKKMNKWVKLNLFFSVIPSELNKFFSAIFQFVYTLSEVIKN